MDMGSARLGMTVAETLRRKTKITRTTSTSAITIVTFTSRTDSRTDSERSNSVSTCTEGGSQCARMGSCALTASATSTVFVPGCRWIASTMLRWTCSALAYHDAV